VTAFSTAFSRRLSLDIVILQSYRNRQILEIARRHEDSDRELGRLKLFIVVRLSRTRNATLQDNHRAVALPQPLPTCHRLSPELLMQVVHYIVDHLDVDLSVSALAKKFSLDEGELLPAVRSHTGIALDQFVLRRRIERALHLLKNSNASDSEIAAGSGWGAESAFQAAFSNYLGVSPTEYRRSLPQKQQAASRERRKRPCKSACLPREESRGRALPVLAVQ
jgi:AraC-like DNA-binding protein